MNRLDWCLEFINLLLELLKGLTLRLRGHEQGSPACDQDAENKTGRRGDSQGLPGIVPHVVFAADIIEMIDAQVQMTSAETNVVQAKFNRAAALASLYRALGRLPAERP